MDYCIYDRNDTCSHGCESCPAYKLRCGDCGAEDDVLYSVCGEILCEECLIREYGEEFYAGFVMEMEDEFRDFVIACCREKRVFPFTHGKGFYI